MSAFYAPRGLVGLLVPQANTTVEPECGMLWPPGVAMLVGRMTSAEPTIEARLADYHERLGAYVAQFADAPLAAMAVAVTGASYVVGPEAEDHRYTVLSRQLGRPATNAALALVHALRVLEARRIALVSPYPPGLTGLSVAYWRARGFDVACVRHTDTPPGPGHPVYSLGGDAAAAALTALAGQDVDAVLLLGTGMPTLPAIARRAGSGRAPVLSSTLALVWHVLECLQGRGAAPSAAALLELVGAPAWRERLAGFALH